MNMRRSTSRRALLLLKLYIQEEINMKSSLLDEKRFVKCRNADGGKSYQMKKDSSVCPACGGYVTDKDHEVIFIEEDTL